MLHQQVGRTKGRYLARRLALEPLETRLLLASGATALDPVAGLACEVRPCDPAGAPVTASPNYSAEGEATATVQFRLEVTDAVGTPISSADVGQQIILDVYVQDLQATGIFAAYLDITYDAGHVAASPLSHSPTYSNSTSGSVSVDGLIDEAGGTDGISPLGGSEFLLFSVPMTAMYPGTINFLGDPADQSPQHDVHRFNSLIPIDPSMIDYGSAQLTIPLPPGVEFDFGDSPDPTYATLLSSNGPRHPLITGAPRLGSSVDGELDGQPNATATGDDNDGNNDDDGIANSPRFILGRSGVVDVDAPLGGQLDAWLDLDGNGVFDHPAEHISGGTSIALTSGVNAVNYSIPASATPGGSFARLRVSTTGNLPPTGLGSAGEVEDYELLVERVFFVNSTTDDGDNNLADDVCDTGATVGGDPECTLRAALEQANATANAGSEPDKIYFEIPGTGPHTITPATAYPSIIDAVVIDGTTQPDFVVGVPLIEIDGTTAGATTDGLQITAGGSTVRGLAINRFGGTGILLASGGSSTLAQNVIGTDPAGMTDLGNGSHGVILFNSSNNVVGGAAIADGNVISGNGGHGIYITRSGSTNNKVQNNVVGLGTDGATQLGNDGAGVRIDQDASGNSIGGSGNVISDNGTGGVVIVGAASTNNTLAGNKIGTDITGLLDRGNAANGITIDGAPGNLIGVPGDGNLISGNAGDGIFVSGTGASGNVVQGNQVGLDVTGNAALPNGQTGLNVFNAPSNYFGGSAAGAGNVISGNIQNGIFIFGLSASGNKIEGNFVGTNATGTAAVGNGLFGLVLREAPGNTVGGIVAGAGNVISGNVEAGIAILNPTATGNVAVGNLIGTDVTGTLDVGNGNTGVLIWKAPGNRVGGLTAAERNIISGNDLFGVRIATFLASGNVVQGNYIGTDITGTTPLANSDTGVHLANAQNSMIGGTVAGARNVISGNGNHGVVLTGGGASGNQVQGNFVGLASTGIMAIGNANVGVQISTSAHDNTIGGTAPGAGNAISANGTSGVLLIDEDTRNNTVAGNLIGTDHTGQFDQGNISNGVAIVGADTNTIGGTTPGAGNVISGNGQFGVVISGATATSNVVQGNAIGTNLAGTGDLGNSSTGVFVTAPGNTIGGVVSGAANLISGNDFVGIRINGAAAIGNLVQGNLIGTQIDAMSPLGNTAQGIRIDNAINTTIGGTAAGAGNVIAHNTSQGVAVLGTATGNSITSNSMFANGGLGIDLNLDGVTANDTPVGDEDVDAGPNQLQNFPVLISAVLDGSLVIDYTVPSTLTNSAYDLSIEFYLADGSGAEGRTLLGEDTYAAGVATDPKQVTLSAGSANVNDLIVATATDANGNTSEFSANLSIVAPPPPPDSASSVASELQPESESVVESESPWQNSANPHDVNNNGVSVDPVGDILSLINEVNQRRISDSAGILPAITTAPKMFFDVNGDGSLTPVGDILPQINLVNVSAREEGEGQVGDGQESQGSATPWPRGKGDEQQLPGDVLPVARRVVQRQPFQPDAPKRPRRIDFDRKPLVQESVSARVGRSVSRSAAIDRLFTEGQAGFLPETLGEFELDRTLDQLLGLTESTLQGGCCED